MKAFHAAFKQSWYKYQVLFRLSGKYIHFLADFLNSKSYGVIFLAEF